MSPISQALSSLLKRSLPNKVCFFSASPHQPLRVYTGGVSLVFYIFYVSICVYFFSQSSFYAQDNGLEYFDIPNLIALVFGISLIFYFYYFTSYILTNRIVLEGDQMICRYFTTCARLKDYFIVPSVTHSIQLSDCSICLVSNLKSFPQMFVCISRSNLRKTLFSYKHLNAACSVKSYANLPSFILLQYDGSSRLIYTLPFTQYSIRCLLFRISQCGIPLVGIPSSK
jgi:hypothetical protein